MTIRVRCLAAMLVLIGGAAVRAEKDAVELLPAQTLACIELRQPARLSREVAALVKGSVLDDLPRLLAKKRAENQGDRGFGYSQQQQMLGMLGIFLCPEMIDEGGRIRGGFIALTGFAKDGMPEVVGALQGGTSNFPGMYMRGFLSFSRPRIVGEVDGVSLYRDVSYVYKPAPPGAPGGAPQSEWHESGPVLAQMPGLILFGSSVDSLKDVIRRAKGKTAEASLANLRAFKESASLRERPGLFAYVDAAALQAKLDEIIDRKDNSSPRFLTGLQTVLGKQTMRKVLFSLTLYNGALESQLRLDFNDKNDSPLFGLLPDRAAQRELLHFAPENALLALTGGLGEGDKRWKTWVNLFDAFYKLDGGGENRPSVAIREMEKKLDLHIDKDVLAELTGAGIVVHKEWRRKSGQATLLLRATDEKAAAKIEKNGLPRLFSLGGEKVLTPKEEEVRGQRIQSITKWGGLQLSIPAVHYGRRGAVLVIGLDRECVAESLITGGKKAGLLTETKIAEAVKDIDEKVVAIGIVSSTQATLDLLAALNRPAVILPKPVRAGLPPPPPPVEQPPAKPVEESKTVQAFRKAGEPLVFTLTRQADSLVLAMRPLPLRRMTPRLLDLWVEMLLKPAPQGNPGNRLPVDEVDLPKR